MKWIGYFREFNLPKQLPESRLKPAVGGESQADHHLKVVASNGMNGNFN